MLGGPPRLAAVLASVVHVTRTMAGGVLGVWAIFDHLRSMTHTAINCGNLWRNFLAQ